MGLERRLGALLFKDFLALHFSQTRPAADESPSIRSIVEVAREIEHAQTRGDVDPEVNPMNSAVFFLLGPLRAADDHPRLAGAEPPCSRTT